MKKLITIITSSVAVASLCCLSSVVIVAFGLWSVSFAASLSDTFYGEYKWYFRGFGLFSLAIGLVMYFRSEWICTLDHVKRERKRIINKLFWNNLDNYPGTGNSPLFTKKVITKVKFRKLKYRIWPSFMGRGADRDFNFEVAETFKNSYVFRIPAYMWRVNNNNSNYSYPINNILIW
jgi:hypothetical protein